VTVYPDTPAIEAARLLVRYSISGLPVVDDEDNLIGIVSEKDILEFVNNPVDTALTVSNLMTKDVISFDEKDSLVNICNCLVNNQFRRVPITSKGKLVGIISRRDILRRLLEMKQINTISVCVEGEDA